jgi:hypothetical protein
MMQGMTLEEVAVATEAASKQYNQKRVPSYCDRILFTSLPGAHKFLTQIAYDSAAEITSRFVCVRAQLISLFPSVSITASIGDYDEASARRVSSWEEGDYFAHA